MRVAALRFRIVALAVLLVAGACGGGDESDTDAGTDVSDKDQASEAVPTGTALSKADISALAGLFPDNPLTGGQEAPRLYRWLNDDVAMFIQFDDSDSAKATELQYVGLSVKGTFCAESQPGGPGGGFSHFHHLDAPDYDVGHGGPAGTPGYWLTWVAVDSFESFDGRQVGPGVDYDFSPTPDPPKCGAKRARADFDAPGAGELDREGIQELFAFFDDRPLTGGQEPPRLYKWVNERVALFAQFDDSDPTKATSLPFIGISVAGGFCADEQPSEDFPHFHRWKAADYDVGHGGKPGAEGAWLLWLATESFAMDDGPQVQPGVFRDMSPTRAPGC